MCCCPLHPAFHLVIVGRHECRVASPPDECAREPPPAGRVSINGASDPAAPFGGYKMSGNGREGTDFAFYEFLETKAL
jgi:aldehyde dehydrogenase family protein